MTLDLEGITVPVVRKSCRHMYIRFSPSDRSASITAPKCLTENEIERFARDKLPWLKKQMKKAESRPLAEVIPLPENARELLTARMGAMIPRCEQLVGKKAEGWRIRDMKSRWGSCSRRTGIITVNLQLVSYPDDCLEYILIHELTHFWVANHGVYFKNRMDRYLPEWKTVRQKLNRTAEPSD